MRRSFISVAASVLVLGAGVAGCGDDSAGSTTPVETVSIADQKVAVQKQLLTDKQLDQFKEGSPQRALMDFWAAVQAGDRRQVLQAYDSGLVETIGAADLVDVARRVGPVYRTGQPSITSASTDDGVATLRYIAPSQAAAGELSPNAMSMRREQGRWVIVYNSALDDELRLTAQTIVQNSINSTAKTLSPKATSAGDQAARRQSKFLADDVIATTP